MRLISFIAILSFGVNCPNFGQNDVLLNTDMDTLLLQINEQDGKLHLDWQELPATNPQSRKEFLSISQVLLEDADLCLIYQLAKAEKGLYYKVKVKLLSVNNDLLSPADGRVLRDYGIVEENFDAEKRIIWTDLTEDVLYYGGTYRVYVTAELWGKVDCSMPRPNFDSQKQWPHYAISGVGLVMIGVGQLYRHQKESAYQNYQAFWLQGKSQQDSERFYNDAKNLDKNTRTLTYAGWGVLGVNFIWAAYRYWHIQKAKRFYDRYCGKDKGVSLHVVPILQPSTTGIGLTLDW